MDPETGKVDILRYTAVQDCGKAIHPSYVEGQIQGGAVQGIGWALNEEYFFNDQGQMVNSSFLDYRMPTSLDLPMIDTVIVEVPHGGHPFAVRGVAELPLVPPMAAIANAVGNAIGVRMTQLPMSPGRDSGGFGGEERQRQRLGEIDMPEVWIPPRMQRITNGQEQVKVGGANVRQVVNNLEKEFPGIKEELCYEDDIMPGLAVIIDGETANLGMLEKGPGEQRDTLPPGDIGRLRLSLKP